MADLLSREHGILIENDKPGHDGCTCLADEGIFRVMGSCAFGDCQCRQYDQRPLVDLGLSSVADGMTCEPPPFP